MSRKPKSTPASVPVANVRQPYFLPPDAPWGGFINIRLDEAQTAEFLLWEETNREYVPGIFDEMLGAGLKTSFSYDASHECYVLALTGALMGSTPNSRFCSTSRGGTFLQVISLTVWKHVVLAHGDYGNYRPRDSSFLSFG